MVGFGGGHLGDRTSALLDGQLSAEETARAWEHVHTCHACRDRVEREGWLKRRLAGLSHDPTASAAPDSLKGTLLGAPADVFFGFHGEYVESRSHRRTVGLAALGGSCVGAAVMGVLAFVTQAWGWRLLALAGAVLTLLAWAELHRSIVAPMRRALDGVHALAGGDLSRPPARGRTSCSRRRIGRTSNERSNRIARARRSQPTPRKVTGAISSNSEIRSPRRDSRPYTT